MRFGNLAPSTQLSPHYTVRDLSVTSTGLPNSPGDAYLGNLKALANCLELLREIGPFTVVSGYRSDAVNNAVGGSETSYHGSGIAADIIPNSMSPRAFWEKIHNTPRFRNALGEYALKESQGALHISAPTSTKRAVDLIVNSAGQYVRSGIDYAKSSPYMVGGVALALGLFAFYRLRSRQ